MQRMSIEFPRHIYAFGGLALAVVLFTSMPVLAGQQLESINPYSAVDPFDPSETITHSLKDDIRLRLRLPAPDLPLSVVEAKQPKPPARKTVTQNQPMPENPPAPGILGNSIKSIMSIFDWPKNTEVAANRRTSEQSPNQSDEPIRINVHVGIQKPQKQPTDDITTEEVSNLQTPWDRNQERVRRLFTFGEIKSHE